MHLFKKGLNPSVFSHLATHSRCKYGVSGSFGLSDLSISRNLSLVLSVPYQLSKEWFAIIKQLIVNKENWKSINSSIIVYSYE